MNGQLNGSSIINNTFTNELQMYRNGLFINRFLHIREHELMMTKSHKNNVDAAFF